MKAHSINTLFTDRELEDYMRRCLFLAQKAEGLTMPNPMVGAVLVHNKTIIGEGFHRQYGKAHAEVECLNSVALADKSKIPDSTLFVNLEPCNHWGKTPPCVEAITKHQIKQVVIGTRDSSDKINGQGIQKLKENHVEVVEGILEQACQKLNKPFFTFHQHKRPYTIVKWAESQDHFLSAGLDQDRIIFSNSVSEFFTHKIRNRVQAIVVGKNTLLQDKPQLTERYWNNQNKTIVILDSALQTLPFVTENYSPRKVIVVNKQKSEVVNTRLELIKISDNPDFVNQLYSYLFSQDIQSILIEGGAKTLHTFLSQPNGIDEIHIVQKNIILANGIKSPRIDNYLQPNWQQEEIACLPDNMVKCYFKKTK